MSSVKIQGSATGTANFTIAVPDGTSTDRTINLPDAAGSFVLADGSGDVTVTGAFTSRGIDDNATSTAMTINSSGQVLVGKTVSDTTTSGNTIYAGIVSATMSGDPAIFANRAQDGSIIELQKNGTSVGSIGIVASRIFIASNNGVSGMGLQFTSDDFRPTDQNGDAVDNTKDVGDSVYRFDDVYATNGTIQTSDANEKQDIAELDEAEKRVATAAKGLIRKFRWIDSVEEKGDDARIHVGVIAQDLQAAFEAEGLDPGRYAMFISSTWWEADETYTDDEGVEQTRTNTYQTAEEAPAGAVERTRLGVRYNQLLAFIIGAI